MKIGKRTIGLDHPPFVIAEMSGNHNGSLQKALEIVDAAAWAGADAMKIQTYTPETMTLPLKSGPFRIRNPKSPWHGRSLYDLYQEAHTPWKWHEPILSRAKKHKMICFSTVFDESSVEFLSDLGAVAFKIASFENNDLPLIRKAAEKGKPMLISTGLASLSEISAAVRTAKKGGCKSLALLKCTSNYPASPKSSNLRTIPDMRSRFGCEVGLSDHTLGTAVSLAAIPYGATLVEKHLTLNRKKGGVDSLFSLEPTEMRRLIQEIKTVWSALGKPFYGPSTEEIPSLQFRRSLFAARDIRKGETFNRVNVRSVRPGTGLSPRFLEKILGKRARKNIRAGEPMRLALVGAR